MEPKKILYMFAGLLLSLNAFSQAPALPVIAPVSPTSAALQKFGDYPVSLYTGLPDITIPVYTIESGGIKVPISLKYHASGLRYDDESREFGIGWTLFAKGMVTKNIMGLEETPGSEPDFNKRVSNIDPHSDGTTSADDHHAMLAGQDSEYDTYDFSFLNYSGKYFYPGSSDPVLIPKSNLKIDNSSGITITDEDGIKYQFNGGTESPVHFGNSLTHLLGTITSADGTHTVTYTYSRHDTLSVGNYFSRRLVLDDKIEVADHKYPTPSGFTYTPAGPSQNHYWEDYQYQRLDAITFNEGSLEFSYDSHNRLTTIEVYAGTNPTPIKVITFTQSAYGTDYYKLDEVKFQDVGNTKSYSYSFLYNGTPYDQISGLDYWGYYNGQSAPSNTYVPDFSIDKDGSSTTLGNADRSPNETAMKKGILTKIVYPTGGYTTFAYEAHRYSSGTLAGGLRIDTISSYDASNTLLGRKWYKYGSGENGDGRIYRAITPDDYCYTYLYAIANSNPVDFDYTYRQRIYRPFPLFSYTGGSGSSVTYDYVTEYTGDGTTANGKIIYQYEDIPDGFSGPYQMASGPIPLVYESKAWKTGQLKEKTVYKYESSTYTPVYSLVNTYTDLSTSTHYSLKYMPYLNWPETGYTANGFGYSYAMEFFQIIHPISPSGLESTFSYGEYRLSTGVRALSNSVETQDGVNKTTTYNTYDGTYDKPKEVEVTQSDGSTRITQYDYPFDGSGVYSTMVGLNMINPVIEQREYKNSTSIFLQSTTTDYYNFDSGLMIKPQAVKTKFLSASPDTRIQYDIYDANGNVQQLSKANGPKITYLWSYGGAYPVAKIENADYSAVESAAGGSGNIATLFSSAPSGIPALETLLGGSFRANLPATAMVTVYVYDPLVGVIAMKDPKGQVTKYEYDELKRLKNVIDQHDNIVTSYDYHYKH